MRATTSGVTHNVVVDESLPNDFLKSEKQKFKKLLKFKNVYYNEDTIVSDASLNYLNLISENKVSRALKNILIKEYYECERIYPYLGDYFLFSLFDIRLSQKRVNKFSKKNQNDFLNNLNSNHVIQITRWIFENINLKRSISVETYHGNDITLEVLDDFIFKCDYDYDFFVKTKDPIKNYRIAIINGMIETVGEIHHLLHKANQNKEPYVIFCYGISEDVKQNIIKNNSLGRTRVYPVCLDANDENTLNILSDFAVIQGGSVISSDLGQTISQEVSKDLNISKEIMFLPGKIIIKPNVDRSVIVSHKNFIKNRIEIAKRKKDVKIEPLQNRLKSFTSSRLNVYIPSKLKKDKKVIRELDYVLRFMSNLSRTLTKVTICEQIFYMPDEFIRISREKLNSLRENFNNINVFIT